MLYGLIMIMTDKGKQTKFTFGRMRIEVGIVEIYDTHENEIFDAGGVDFIDIGKDKIIIYLQDRIVKLERA